MQISLPKFTLSGPVCQRRQQREAAPFLHDTAVSRICCTDKSEWVGGKGMFVVTLSKASVKKLGVGAMCCALVVFSAMLGRYISTRSVAVAAASNKIESAQDIQTWFTGYGCGLLRCLRRDALQGQDGGEVDSAHPGGQPGRCEQLRRAAGLQEKGRGCVSVGKALRHRHRAERRPDCDGPAGGRTGVRRGLQRGLGRTARG